MTSFRMTNFIDDIMFLQFKLGFFQKKMKNRITPPKSPDDDFNGNFQGVYQKLWIKKVEFQES